MTEPSAYLGAANAAFPSVATSKPAAAAAPRAIVTKKSAPSADLAADRSRPSASAPPAPAAATAAKPADAKRMCSCNVGQNKMGFPAQNGILVETFLRVP